MPKKIYITMMNKSLVALGLMIMLLTSCASKKNVLYFQDADKYASVDITQLETKIQVNDILSITVSALVPETAIPYNIQTGSTSNGVGTPETMKLQGYLVSPKGEIELPVLGNLVVKNKSLSELGVEIKTNLEKGGHLVKPTVNIRILNAKFTILGEVRSPGTYTISEPYISLPQALGYAGDLTIDGKRKDVLLIRENDGVRTITHIDLTSAGWMNDPKYSIKQNDVIVVNPSNNKVKSTGYIGNLGTMLTIASLLLSSIILLKR